VSKLSYPVGPDAIDAALVAAGMPAPECMKLTGLALCALSAVMLWLWSRAFGIAFFLLSGSLLYLASVFGVGTGDYDPHWKNLFLTTFAPQRGLQIALPLGILVLLCCRSIAVGSSARAIFAAALALSIMPFSSVHACLVLFPILVLTVWLFPARSSWAAVVLAATGMSLSAYLIGAWEKTSAIRVEFFLGEGRLLDVWAWLVNFGALIPLLLLATYLSVRTALGKGGRVSVSPNLLRWEAIMMCFLTTVFAFSLFISVSPWSWDNTKIMFWVVVASSPLIWKHAISPLLIPWRSLLLILLFAPSIPLLSSELSTKNRGHGLFPSDEYNEGISAKKTIPELTLLAAAPDYNHPWLASGHYFLSGYEGWLWSHGSNYAQPSSALRKILRGEGDWERSASTLGVTHILWGPREQRFAGKQNHPAEKAWKLVRSGKSGKLYSRH
jgi:hypothetical protein